ncbi:hypothetical protein LMG28727_05299 [Paraburkholderia kirstenboschensis]|nr:hypothetical protein LMG28727_05299 [Paraburkholderia kirstenboschensis]
MANVRAHSANVRYPQSREARRCRRCATVPVRAAGPRRIAPVEHPASCPLRPQRVDLPDHGTRNDVVLVDNRRCARLLEQHSAQIALA